jgi:hypothetical protein
MLGSVDFTSQTRGIFAVYGQKLSKKVQTLMRPLWLGSGSLCLGVGFFLNFLTHIGLLSKLEWDDRRAIKGCQGQASNTWMSGCLLKNYGDKLEFWLVAK